MRSKNTDILKSLQKNELSINRLKIYMTLINIMSWKCLLSLPIQHIPNGTIAIIQKIYIHVNTLEKPTKIRWQQLYVKLNNAIL